MDKAYGGDQVTSQVKFDEYFAYGIDNVGGEGNNAPPCGPGDEQVCQELVYQQGGSHKSCCAHVVMTDGKAGEQMSFYRCMNEQVVDVNMNVQFGDMDVSMWCPASGSTYLGSAILASLVSLVTASVF